MFPRCFHVVRIAQYPEVRAAALRELHPAHAAYVPNRSSSSPGEALDDHMKRGPHLHYWNEFVFEGYVNHRPEAIYLEACWRYLQSLAAVER
jgi:hypothetical protein